MKIITPRRMVADVRVGYVQDVQGYGFEVTLGGQVLEVRIANSSYLLGCNMFVGNRKGNSEVR